MIRFVFLWFSLLLISSKTVACSNSICDTIPSYLLKEQGFIEEDDTDAEWWLTKAKAQNRKAIQAMFFSVLTIGVLYPLALFWSITAFYNSRKAYYFYKKKSLNKHKKTESNKAYWNSISILIIHLSFWSLLFLRRLISFINTQFLAPSARIVFIALLGIGLFLVLDYFFFKTFF